MTRKSVIETSIQVCFLDDDELVLFNRVASFLELVPEFLGRETIKRCHILFLPVGGDGIGLLRDY